MNDGLEGKRSVGDLMDNLNAILFESNWNPKDVEGDSTIQFVEVKALLVNAKKKLKKISIREGYE